MKSASILRSSFLALSAISGAAAAVKYSEYILAPTSRTLYPASVYRTNGTVANPANLVGAPNGGLTTLHNVASITYDFGKNIEGIVSLDIASAAKGQYVGVTFTESSLWISTFGCDATADSGLDVPLWFSGKGAHTVDPKYRRGAFRYMTLQTNSTGAVQVADVSISFTAYPQAAEGEIGDYPGYFHSNDEELNAVWYAGAYTNQLCHIQADSGNSLVHLGIVLTSADDSFLTTWWNNYTNVNGSVSFVDGAKRDRTVWPGDYTVSIPSSFVSFNDLTGARNGLASLFVLQTSDGAMPYAGVPFIQSLADLGVHLWSFTYHCHGLTDLYLYYMYTGDMAYLQTYWGQAKLGLEYAFSFIDNTGLATLPPSNPDWLRNYMGGYNIEANSILYRLIGQMTFLANVLDDTAQVSNWTSIAATIKTQANARLWSASSGLYTDNTTTTFNPQDGNVFAIISGVADYEGRDTIVSQSLQARWTPYGPPAPEAGATISPFISSFELQAHMAVGNPQASIDLMKSMWFGWMMNNPQMTNSTFVEGYGTDGQLIYPAYKNNPRISHAHGWSTGPVSTLSTLVAGIQFVSAAGKKWLFAPQVGDLTSIDAGYPSTLGMFTATYAAVDTTGFLYQFSAPSGTSGSVSVVKPVGCTASGVAILSKGVMSASAIVKVNVAGVKRKTIPAATTMVGFTGLKGNDWTLYFACGQ